MSLMNEGQYHDFMQFYNYIPGKSLIGQIVESGIHENYANYALRCYMRDMDLLSEYEYFVHYKELHSKQGQNYLKMCICGMNIRTMDEFYTRFFNSESQYFIIKTD